MFIDHITLAILIAPAIVAFGQELDSAQQRQLKDAEYYLKQVEKELPDITETARKYAESVSGVSENDVHKYLNKVNWTGGKLDNVLSRLPSLPQTHPDVVKINNRVKELATALMNAENALKAAQQNLAGINDASSWPDLEKDKKEIEELSLMIANADVLRNNVKRAARICKEIPQIIAYIAQMEEKYAALISQPDLLGRSIKEPLTGFDDRLEKFRAVAKEQQQALPGRIQKDLDEALAMATKAVAEKNARLFSGGVPQSIRWAQDKLVLLETLSKDYPELAQMARKNFDSITTQIAALQEDLEKDIISANAGPEDSYNGSDKARLTQMVTDKWKAAYPDDKILGVRWAMKTWDRSTYWEWQGSKWHKFDYSELHASIVVQSDDDVATIFYAYCVKDHLKQDAIRITEDDKTRVGVHRKMLVGNFK